MNFDCALNEAELERERQVVLQELGQARDTPDDIVFDHLQSAIFKDQPLGWPILGEEKSVNAFSRPMLKDYMQQMVKMGPIQRVVSAYHLGDPVYPSDSWRPLLRRQRLKPYDRALEAAAQRGAISPSEELEIHHQRQVVGGRPRQGA